MADELDYYAGLQIGDRVRTPDGDGIVASAVYRGMGGLCYDVAIPGEMGGQPVLRVRSWHVADMAPLPSDIPRERVEALAAEAHAQYVTLLMCGYPAELAEAHEYYHDRLREMLEATDGE